MKEVKYNPNILLCGQGSGFNSSEVMLPLFRVLEELGLVPDQCLCSSGATLFTSLYYSKGIDWCEDTVRNTPVEELIVKNTLPIPAMLMGLNNHYYNNDAIYKLLLDNMNGNASKHVKTSAVNANTYEVVLKNVTPGWSLAATSIPFVFKPVKIGDQYWRDGGTVNNIVVPHLNDVPKWDKIFICLAPEDPIDSGDSIIDAAGAAALAVCNRELHQLKEIGYLEQENVTVIQPPSAMSGGLLNWSDNYELIPAVYDYAKELLTKVVEEEPWLSTLD